MNEIGSIIGKKCEFKPEFQKMQGRDLTVKEVIDGRVTMVDENGIEFVANLEDIIIK